jgi:hypothetical protein
MGFANQRGETALQEENDRVGLNGVNCRNSLRVNCSTIELGTRGIWVAFGLFTNSQIDFATEQLCACEGIKTDTLSSRGGGWQAEIRGRARFFFRPWTEPQFAGTELRSSQIA